MNLLARRILRLVLVVSLLVPGQAADTVRLEIQRAPGQIEMNWPAATRQAGGSMVRPYFEVQRTFDFRRWAPVGERLRAPGPGDKLRIQLEAGLPRSFYRVLEIAPRSVAKLAAGGAEVFGYNAA